MRRCLAPNVAAVISRSTQGTASWRPWASAGTTRASFARYVRSTWKERPSTPRRTSPFARATPSHTCEPLLALGCLGPALCSLGSAHAEGVAASGVVITGPRRSVGLAEGPQAQLLTRACSFPALSHRLHVPPTPSTTIAHRPCSPPVPQ